MLAACGRLGFEARTGDAGPGDVGDAAPDATAVCTNFGPWSAPMLAPINSGSTDWGPMLAHGDLSLVFSSDRGGNYDLWLAERASAAVPFGAPAPLLMALGSQLDPWISADGLTLFYGNNGISQVTRPTAGGPWSAPIIVLPASTALYSGSSGPDFSPDLLHLYFTADRAGGGGQAMWEATRPTSSSAFGTPVVLDLGISTDPAFGSARGDGLEVVFQSGGAGADLFASTRAMPSGPFGPAQPLAILDSAADEVDGDLSDDGLTVWFALTRAGGWDLYVATRSCL
ncbi:hypothetical protein BH11MYX3_BH11MYX3_27160 [soil metagenome]